MRHGPFLLQPKPLLVIDLLYKIHFQYCNLFFFSYVHYKLQGSSMLANNV